MTLTSLFDLAGRGCGRGTFSIKIGTGLDTSLLLLLLVERILRVNLDEILDLRVLDLLSVYNTFQLELYMDEMKFHMESPKPSRSNKFLTFEASTFLFLMYLAIKFKKSLILLMSEAICSIEPWREIGWKLPLHKSGSVGALGSYGNWISITSLLSPCGASTWGGWMFWFLLRTHWGFKYVASLLPPWGLIFSVVSSTLLKWNAFFCSVS